MQAIKSHDIRNSEYNSSDKARSGKRYIGLEVIFKGPPKLSCPCYYLLVSELLHACQYATNKIIEVTTWMGTKLLLFCWWWRFPKGATDSTFIAFSSDQTLHVKKNVHPRYISGGNCRGKNEFEWSYFSPIRVGIIVEWCSQDILGGNTRLVQLDACIFII